MMRLLSGKGFDITEASDGTQGVHGVYNKTPCSIISWALIYFSDGCHQLSLGRLEYNLSFAI